MLETLVACFLHNEMCFQRESLVSHFNKIRITCQIFRWCQARISFSSQLDIISTQLTLHCLLENKHKGSSIIRDTPFFRYNKNQLSRYLFPHRTPSRYVHRTMLQIIVMPLYTNLILCTHGPEHTTETRAFIYVLLAQTKAGRW